ncbi:MAG: helix-turn-helix domain-containing protein [Oscillospiraceae bacterium]|nr:helix-turn-helix domain-containing protein [Oscillospiraceae bacterium]
MFFEKLANLRSERDLTQTDMAKYLNISQQAYSNYESGKCEVDFSTLCALADFFYVTADYLLGRDDATNTPYTSEEVELIFKYRDLDERGRATVRHCVKFEFSQSARHKKTAALAT